MLGGWRVRSLMSGWSCFSEKNSLSLILRENSVRSLCNSYSFTLLFVGQKVRPRSRIPFSSAVSVLEMSITLLGQVARELVFSIGLLAGGGGSIKAISVSRGNIT